MASRKILRVDLSSETRLMFESAPEVWGMTQVAVTSKLFEWFFDQNDIIQASILGFYPNEVSKGDITAAVLREFISSRGTKRPAAKA